MLRYYKQKHHFINFFVNIHICLLSVSKSSQQRYIFSCLWRCQQLPVCFKMSQSVPICLKMFQNVSKSTQFFSKLILRHFETFWVDFEQFWAILSGFFGAGMRHFETFWVDVEQFWAILSGFLGQVWNILRHFELILSNFEQFWAILSGICSASNLYIWIVLSVYMSFLHNWNSQIMEIEA